MSAAALLQNKSWKESEIGENFCVEGIIPLNISRIKALCLQTHMLIPYWIQPDVAKTTSEPV